MTQKEKYKLVEKFIIENQQAHYRLAYSYLKNKENALDIIQDSVIKALRSIDKLDELDYLKTWFYRILVNTALDFLKKHKKLTVMDDQNLEFHLPAQSDEMKEFDLYHAIDHLPVSYKSVIILRYFEDMKIEEIARVLNENVNTIKTRLYAALKKLRVELEEEEFKL